jgi:hypothetical protein
MIETKRRSLSIDDPGWPWLLGPVLAVVTLLVSIVLAWLAMMQTLHTHRTFFAHVPRRPLDPSFQLATDFHILWVGTFCVGGMGLAAVGLRRCQWLPTLAGTALSLIASIVLFAALGNAADQITTCQHHDPCPLDLGTAPTMANIALLLIVCLTFGLAVQLLRMLGGLVAARRAR